MTRLLGIFFFFLFANESIGNNKADYSFYLADSIPFEKLSEFDKFTLDSILRIYHSTDDDSVKILSLNNIAYLTNDLYLSELYRAILWNFSDSLVRHSDKSNNYYRFYVQALARSFSAEGYMLSAYYGKLDSALWYYEKALEMYKQINSLEGEADVYSDMGYEFSLKGEYIKAVDYYNKSLKISSQVQSPASAQNMIYTYSYLAGLNQQVKNYDLAEHHLATAYSMADSLKDLGYLGYILFQQAELLMEKGNFEEALSVGLESIEVAKKSHDQVNLGMALNQVGMSYFKMEDYQNAKIYADKSIKELAGYTDELATAFTTLSQTELALNNLSIAEISALKVLDLTSSLNLRKIASQVLKEVYIAKGDNNKALKYANYQLEIISDLDDDEETSAILNQYIQYTYNQQKSIDSLASEQKVQLVETQKQKTRLGMFAFAGVSVVIALAAFLIFNRLKLIRRQRDELDFAYAKLEESKKNEVALSNLKALKSQMNPHFIFNLLNSIQHLVLKGDIENSYGFINQFAGLVRSTLDYSDREKITLGEEIELLEVYLRLEKVRFQEDFEYEIFSDQPKNIFIPPMLIQPFVENALVHGLLHKEGLRKLKISFKITNVVECEVADNGIGKEKAKVIRERQRGSHKSFSTQAIEKRFAILSEYHKEDIGYEYIDYDQTIEDEYVTKVNIRIPIVRKEN